MKLRSKDGVEMIDVASIKLEGGKLFVRGKMMGAMPAVIIVDEANLWEAFDMVSWRLLLKLPLMLFKGWRLRSKS